MATLVPYPKFQAFDINGDPLIGGKLYTYEAGTDTPLAVKTSYLGGSNQTNPVVLDSRGEADVWPVADQLYKFVLKTAADVTIWTVDNIGGAFASDITRLRFVSQYNGTIEASDDIGRWVVDTATTLPASLTGSYLYAKNAPTAQVTCPITKTTFADATAGNPGSSIGSAVTAIGAHFATFTFASQVSLAAGDILAITGPASPDATYGNVSSNVVGTV